VIELLGVGVRGEADGWRLHRVCARWERGQLIAVVSKAPAERLALVDAVAGCLVPAEGRVWLDRVPLSRETMSAARARLGDVDLRIELAMARALRRRPERLVIREVDVVLGMPDAERLLSLVRTLVHADRLTAVVSVASLSLARRLADRVVVIADGLLVLDAPPDTFTQDEIAWRLQTASDQMSFH
jgi:ABC-type cobalamin/Fe3+-siderophores transport system ATPase subunit